jgi:hypothetical protein
MRRMMRSRTCSQMQTLFRAPGIYGPVARQSALANSRAIFALGLALAAASNLLGICGAQSQNDRDIAVYYLSPRVYTRTMMTPERLKTETYRVRVGNLPLTQINKVYEMIQARGRQFTRGGSTRFDFRLCISSREGDLFFNSSGKVAFVRRGTFKPSEDEEPDVRSLFERLEEVDVRK